MIQYRKCGIEIGKHQEPILVKKKIYCIYITPWSKFREAEGHLTMRLCLQDAVINYAPRIGKYINKHELYRQWHPRRMKDTNISEIENTSSVRNVMRVTPVSGIEREPWRGASILRIFNYLLCICTCSVRSDEYKCMTKHDF